MTGYHINNLRVIGEVVKYSLKDNEKEVTSFLGGAYATTQLLKNAFLGFNIKVYGYQGDPQPSATVSRRIEKFSKSSQAPDQKVWRCIVEPALKTERNPSSHLSEENPNEKSEILVIEDLGEFIDNHQKDILDKLVRWHQEVCYPQLILMININSPDPKKITEEHPLWKKLYEHKDKVLVIIDADHLCLEGMNISRGISWERTAQDYLAELFTHSLLQKIGKFQHLVVRFGVGGVIYSFRVGKRRHHRLFFDPESYQMGLDGSDDGFMFGNNPILAVSIIKEIVGFVNNNNNSNNCHNEYAIIDRAIGTGIRRGLHLCQKNHEHGFGDGKNINGGQFYNIFNLRIGYSIFNICQLLFKFIQTKPTLFYLSLLQKDCTWTVILTLLQREIFEGRRGWKRIANERIPVGNPAWSILNQSAEYNLLKIAEKIVRKGEIALNNASLGNKSEDSIIWTPIVKFTPQKEPEKTLIVVDRREIESYCIAHRLIQKTMLTDKSERPLSLAVFGPPGAGKSFVAKTIVNSVKSTKEVEFKTYNLAELPTANGFKKRIEREIKKIGEEDNKIPVIFFDEFDCKLGDQELGWLKYFLPLMEDFKLSKEAKITPIFVFAGGTSHNYLDFTREDPSLKEEEEAKFAMAKGPDFVSRLLGHIDILGPNPVDEYDDAYLVRRAIVLRLLLKDCNCMEEGIIGEDRVSTELIGAMLKISSYKHGTRSMRAIVNMSVKFGGERGRYVSSSLPTLPQLNMHVNGKEFIELLLEAKKLSTFE